MELELELLLTALGCSEVTLVLNLGVRAAMFRILASRSRCSGDFLLS